jgi:hypothetical protein
MGNVLCGEVDTPPPPEPHWWVNHAVGVGDACLPRLAIAMLIKDPNITALRSFIRYHRHLGFERFEFFLDDTSAGVDAPACNDRCAACLAETALLGPGIVANRCNLQWWAEQAQPHSRAWETWGEHLHSDVISRQVLAVEVAVRNVHIAGLDWLLHIDVDEALCFGLRAEQAAAAATGSTNTGAGSAGGAGGAGGAGSGAGCVSDASAASAIAGSAQLYFARVPPALDELVFMNHEAGEAGPRPHPDLSLTLTLTEALTPTRT